MRNVYGDDNIQECPQPGNFPLLGLEDKTIALLDDWRFDETVLPISAQLLWYEGKPLPLTRPQNQQSYVGHFLYKGGAPIFITTKEEDFEKIERPHVKQWINFARSSSPRCKLKSPNFNLFR